MTTIKEMREEITRIRKANMDNLTAQEAIDVAKRFDELLTETAVNKTKAGVQRYYLTKDAPRAVVMNYLECLINACYDVLGYCL